MDVTRHADADADDALALGPTGPDGRLDRADDPVDDVVRVVLLLVECDLALAEYAEGAQMTLSPHKPQ